MAILRTIKAILHITKTVLKCMTGDGSYRYTYVTDIPFGSFYVNDGVIYTLTDNQGTFLTEVYRYRIQLPPKVKIA